MLEYILNKEDSTQFQKIATFKIKMYLTKLKEMFEKMVIKKDASLIPFYYHQDFLLYTNEQVTDYNAFLKSHQEYYKTSIQYEVEYD